jgi:xylan 1,4-beta-xylosidase
MHYDHTVFAACFRFTLGHTAGDRASVTSSGAASLESMFTGGARDSADESAMASIDAHSAAVLVSNYHASGKPGPTTPIDLRIAGLPHGRMLIQHFRVDDQHSNSFEAWRRMGSPSQPTPNRLTCWKPPGNCSRLNRRGG